MIGNLLAFAVEADNEPAVTHNTKCQEFTDGIANRFVYILGFLVLFQCLILRCFDSQEYIPEINILHQLKQLIIISQVNRGFSGEIKRITVVFGPCFNFTQ